jgi:uncharacterized protein (TIGR00730 family)
VAERSQASPPPPPTTPDEELLNCVGPAATTLRAGDDARLDFIRDEFARGFRALGHVERAVSVFGSARTGRDHPDYELARRVGRQLGLAGFSVITGGGPGIMEAANRGAQEAGAESIGLNIDLPFEQALNDYVDIGLQFEHFYARKVMFVRYASAFVVFPGGYGTLDELFEALTLIQTATISHFPVLLVGRDHWRGLLAWVDEQLVTTGKIEPSERDLLQVVDDADDIVEHVLGAYASQAESTRARS